jgi:cobalamin biosynthesis Mg chelatase CobN
VGPHHILPGLTCILCCCSACVVLQAWLLQAVRLCQLCCLVLCAGPAESDPVVDAAAARLLQLMTCADYWGRRDKSSSSTGAAPAPSSEGSPSVRSTSSAGDGQASAAAAAATVLSGLCQQPLPLLQAARRLVLSSTLQAQQQAAADSPASPAAGMLQASMVTTAGALAAGLSNWILVAAWCVHCCAGSVVGLEDMCALSCRHWPSLQGV